MSANSEKLPARRQARSKRRPQKVPNVSSSVVLTESENPGPTIEDGVTSAMVASVEDEDQGDVGICFICAEPVKFYSISECNHRICHVCALRLRALYKRLDCTFCKHPQAHVLFVASSSKLFSDYDLEDMRLRDTKLSIIFETQEMMEEALILLRFNCPITDCTFIAKGWGDLKLHVKGEHGKVTCDLCIKHKKIFSHEHALYTPSELRIHLPSLSPQRDFSGLKEKVDIEGGVHPFCKFCLECFFSDDELFHHLRERHEECFICKRQGVRDQYFRNYQSLEEHFNEAHYSCTESSCLSQKFVVFGSLMDLKAHMVEQHGAAMSTKERKGIRRVETNFRLEDRRRPAARRNDRDEDQSVMHVSLSSMSLDQQRGTFNGALTSSGAAGLSHTARILVQQSEGSHPQLPADNDPEIVRRHANFMERLNSLANGSTMACASILSAIKSFRASESTARDLINTIHNVVDRDVGTTASFISPLADLLDDEDKKRDLLATFNGFKIEQRQEFPDLIPGGSDAAYAGVASGRVLNAKNSTQSRRSAAQVLDRVARAASSSHSRPITPTSAPRISERFPVLHGAMSGAGSVPPNGTNFRKATIASLPSTSRIRSEKPKSVPSGPSPKFSEASFPSLPTVSTRSKLPGGVIGGNKPLRNATKSQASTRAWNPTGSTESQNNVTSGEAEQDVVDASLQERKGKKKGKEKMVLFTLGQFPT